MPAGDETAPPQGRRYLVTAVVHEYLHDKSLNLPALKKGRDRIVEFFSAFGYEHIACIDNPTREDLVAGLREFCLDPERTPDDYVVVYVGCHGEAIDVGSHAGDLALLMADVHPRDHWRGSITAGEVAEMLLAGTPLRRLLVVLDACFSGQGVLALTRVASAYPAGQVGLAREPYGTAVISSALSTQWATQGAFTGALRNALAVLVERQGSAARVGLEAVLNEVAAQLPQDQQPTIALVRSTGIPSFLGKVDAAAEIGWAPAEQRKRRAADMTDRFRRHVSEFRGRGEARGEIVAWLARPSDRRALLVAGGPGSGKTALLGWLASVSDPGYVDLVPRDGLPKPAPNAVDVAIYAGGLTARHVVAGMVVAAGISDIDLAEPLESVVSALLAALAGHERPLVVLIDALDETLQLQATVVDVLVPLIRGGVVRLLLGGRPEVIGPFGAERSNLLTVNLDAPRFADRDSIKEIVRNRLRRAWPAEDRLDGVTTEITRVAGHSFFLAKLLADKQAAQAILPDSTDGQWLASLPRDAGQAMYDDLADRLGGDTARSIGLLLPLAYVQGDGLPWAGIWPQLARALTPDDDYLQADPVRLLRDVESYLVEGTETDGGRVYRLCHQALADHLRLGRDELADQRRIVEALITIVPHGDWSQAHPYVKRHLVQHAMVSGDIERLVQDPRFLLANEPSVLMPALDVTTSLPARIAADAYRLALPALRRHTRDEHAAYLALAARGLRADDFADWITVTTAWRARWASWQPHRPHMRIDLHTQPVNSVMYSRIRRRPTGISGSDDGRILVWDAQTGGPLREPMSGHEDAVTALALTDREWVVSGSVDRTVRVWDLTTGEVVGQPFAGHQGSVRAVAVGWIGGVEVVVSGGDDRSVRFSDPETGDPVGRPFLDHKASITALAFGRVDDTSFVASGDADGTVLVWDPAADEPVMASFFYPRKVRDIVTAGSVVISGCDDTKIRVFDVRTRKTRVLSGHITAVHAVTVAEIAGKSTVVSGGEDGSIRMFDLATGKQVGEMVDAHSRSVRTLSFGCLDGRPTIVSGGTDSSVRVWDMGLATDIAAPFAGHRQDVRSLAVARLDDRPAVVSGSKDATVRVWDLRTGRPVGEPYTGHNAAVVALAACRLGDRWVVVSGDNVGVVQMWSIETRELIARHYTGVREPVTALAVGHLGDEPVAVIASRAGDVRAWSMTRHTPIGEPFWTHRAAVRAVAAVRRNNGTVVVSGGDERNARVWSVDPRNIVGPPFTQHAGNVTALTVVDPLVVSGDDKGTILAWDLHTRARVGVPFAGHTKQINALTVVSRWVVSGSADGTARTWDLATHEPLEHGLVPHSDEVRALAVSELGGVPVAVSGNGSAIKIWDVGTGTERFARHQHWVRAVAVGEIAGRRVVVTGSVDTTIRVWDLDDGEAIGRTITGHTHGVRAVAVTQLADGRPVAVSGADDTTVRIWDLVTREQIGRSMTGHGDWVRALAIDPQGPVVVSAGGSSVRRWHLPSGEPMGEAYSGHSAWVRAVAIGRFGGRSTVASASADGTVHVWDLAYGSRIGKPFTGHRGPVRDVAIVDLSDVPVVISSGDDGTVRAWELATGAPIGGPLAVCEPQVGTRVAAWSMGHGLISTTAAVQVATAAGDRVRVDELAMTGSWRNVAIVDVGSRVLGVTFASRDRLVLAGKLGTVVLDLQTWDQRERHLTDSGGGV